MRIVYCLVVMVALLVGCGDPAEVDDTPECVVSSDCPGCDVCIDKTCRERPEPEEICFNGIDEDCDGVPDDGCISPCHGIDMYCDGVFLVSCENDIELVRSDCTLAPGGYCSDGGCRAGCTPGHDVCRGGATGHPSTCAAATGELVQVDTCELDEHCRDGICVPDVCDQGVFFCKGGVFGVPTVCDPAGTVEIALEPCAPEQICQAGHCVEGPRQPSSECTRIRDEILAGTGHTITVAAADGGGVTVDGTTSTLRNVVASASAGDTILLEDGVYTFGESDGGSYTGLYFTTENVTLRSASGNAEAVTLDSAYADHGNSTAPVTIAAPGVTIASITISRSIFHLIHVWTGGDDVRIHDVRLIDGGQQFVKASPGDSDTVDGGSVTCSTFTLTDQGRANVWGYGPPEGSTRCYTGGIDTHRTNGWTITDNTFQGIYCDTTTPHPAHGKLRDGVAQPTYVGGLAEHAIHMWDSGPGSRHVIERNLVINCARGIGLGLGSTLRVHGGLVRNNMVFSDFPGGPEHDVGIIIEGGQNVEVHNNTVFFSHPDAYPNSIETRFETTTGAELVNNLTNREIRARDGAEGTTTTNVTSAIPAWFESAATGELHLAACDIPQVAGAGTPIADLVDDFDGDPRGSGNPDIGADQCR